VYQIGYFRLLVGMYAQNVTASTWQAATTDVLRDMKDARGLTFDALAVLTGMPAISLKRYLTGKREVNVSDFGRIVSAMGGSPAAAFAEVERRVQGDDTRDGDTQ